MRVRLWRFTIGPVDDCGPEVLRKELRGRGYVVISETELQDASAYALEVGARVGKVTLVDQDEIEQTYRVDVDVQQLPGEVRLRWWRYADLKPCWWPRVVRQPNGCRDVTVGWWTWTNEPETDAELEEDR